ncbi:MAG: flagellar M-ring protein FliF [Lachnospiraceae bacterium]|nr:flagellar M-ring protein FliF [Lachnospiraceae bacterium]
MSDKLKQIPEKLLEWWNKFNPRQKTIIISAFAGVVLMFSVLGYVLTRPQYIPLVTCESQKEASEIVKLLEGENLKYQTSTDGLRVSILKSQEGEANLLLGANNIPSDTYGTINDVISGGFSTTEADKQKRYKVWLQKDMESTLQTNEAVKRAKVDLTIPEQDGTLIAQDKESFAAVTLTIEDGMEILPENAAALARYVATALGNTSTDSITIIDTRGNLLFAGEDNNNIAGNANTQLDAKSKAEEIVKSEVRSVLIGTTLYDTVEVTSNLKLDFSTREQTDHTFQAPEGSEGGLLSEERVYDAENQGITGGEPGTGSNGEDGASYVLSDYADSSSTLSERESKYLQDESVTTETKPPGDVIYEESSIGIAATKLHVYKEEDVQKQGLLEGITWDEFKVTNGEVVKLEVDEEIYALVAKATGISEENIQIVAQEKPIFIDREGLSVGTWDVVQIVLIVLILALLAFVVLRSMRGARGEQVEEELSVESLLQSTPAAELEDIELEEKSETRKLIEKFVDENPEAVASLLRNWLTEEWG